MKLFTTEETIGINYERGPLTLVTTKKGPLTLVTTRKGTIETVNYEKRDR